MSDKPALPSHVGRRDFLKISSLAIAGVAGGSLPAFAAAIGERVDPALVSIGYAAEEPQTDGVVRLVGAETLTGGDPEFLSRDALVTICSSAWSQAASPKARGAAIDVVYPAFGYQPGQYPTYRAWSCRFDAYGFHRGGGVAFRVPVEATSGLQFFLTNFRTDDPPETEQMVVTPRPDEAIALSIGGERATPKLRRGVYVVAYRTEDEHRLPAWQACVLARDGHDLAIPGAAFSYVVLRVDYPPAV